MIEMMAAERCNCKISKEGGESFERCEFCAIYVVAHGAGGCGGNKTCPSMLEGQRDIKRYYREKRETRRARAEWHRKFSGKEI